MSLFIAMLAFDDRLRLTQLNEGLSLVLFWPELPEL